MSDPVYLILDDDPAALKFMSRCLEDLPGEIRTASTIDEARAILSSGGVDLLISDVRLPGQSDLQMLDWPELAACKADSIIVTGFPDADLAIDALHRGVFDFLRKPFEPNQLVSSVKRCIERRSLRQQNVELVASLTTLNQELERTVAARTAELRDAYEELVEAKTRLDRLEEHKTRFIGIVSHEFNTPLNVIKGYLGLFHDGVFGKLAHDQTDALRTLEREVDRIAELMREFTTIHSLENESWQFQTERINVKPFVRDAVEKLGPFFTSRRHQFILNVPDELPQVEANPRQLSILIENLLVNAIRFTPDGGLITFSAQPHVRKARLGVLFVTRDTGVGIPKDEYTRIFERFYELGDINRHSSGRIGFGQSGLGLGLAIARRIVEGHGGEIWVESEVDEGSRFYFFLPGARKEQASKDYTMPADSTVMLKLEEMEKRQSSGGAASDDEDATKRPRSNGD
ncbi:MAG: ATP-binding protein [Planctomycetota bacterium]